MPREATWQGCDQWKVMRPGAMRCDSSTMWRTSSMRSISTFALMGLWKTCADAEPLEACPDWAIADRSTPASRPKSKSQKGVRSRFETCFHLQPSCTAQKARCIASKPLQKRQKWP